MYEVLKTLEGIKMFNHRNIVIDVLKVNTLFQKNI